MNSSVGRAEGCERRVQPALPPNARQEEEAPINRQAWAQSRWLGEGQGERKRREGGERREMSTCQQLQSHRRLAAHDR
eukprot:COSAG01_NODE_2505_length_7553_cov_11.744030_7_plen_78_part_00